MLKYLLIIFFVIIIVMICYLIYNKVIKQIEAFQSAKKTVKGKTIWLLWLQGWDDNTPWLVQQVKKSWEILNPTWNIELVTQNNLSQYVDIHYIDNNDIQAAAKSDIIRLHLLAEHGGVWADATMLCMMSLDNWIYDAMTDCNFWMYHGRDYGRGPASWFMISIKDSYIARRWKEETNKFWEQKIAEGSVNNYDYFWMDNIFKNLCETDNEFLKEWNKVPYLWCESRGQAHMLAEKCLNDNKELKDILLYNPPYVVKLSRHGFDENKHKNTNAYAAITSALEQKYAPYPLHKMEHANIMKHTWRNTVAVSADCGGTSEIKQLQELCLDNNIELIIYDKCNFCKNIPKEITCRPLKNVGRESNTFLYFVIKYYDNLPENILFIPSALDKHDRLERFKKMIENKDETGCSTVHTLGSEENFKLSEYEGKPIELADTRPLRAWYERYIGVWDSNILSPCWNGMMRTNKQRILRRPKYFYINLYNQVSQADNIETGHYMERVMQNVF